jgi:hypothetical protein
MATAGVPDPGSEPRLDAAANPGLQNDIAAGNGGGGADQHERGWPFDADPETGAQIFAAGFAALLFSIGGLVTVGIRRRRW